MAGENNLASSPAGGPGAKRKRSESGAGSGAGKNSKGTSPSGSAKSGMSPNGVSSRNGEASKAANGTAIDLPKKRVAYFYDAELSVYEHNRGHKFKPFRAKLAHELIDQYGAYKDMMDVLRPRLVTRTDMGQYHSDAYLEILATAQATANKRFGWAPETAALEEDPTAQRKVDEVFKRFNIELDPEKSSNAVFPGVLDYCRLYTSGSMGCALRLTTDAADVAINWYGGMNHARGSRAQAGCYVNDSVLATLELLKRFKRVMYINLSGVHADAVEEAFYTTNRVMTVSFHLDANHYPREWPGTGLIEDVGAEEGEGYAVNVPMDPGMTDGMLVSTFTEVISKAMSVYEPEAIVMQCGGGLLSTERGGDFNITEKGYAECVRLVRDADLPLLMLGGNGSNMARTARMWAYVTMVLLGKESLLKDNVIPEQVPSRYYFEPLFEVYGPEVNMPNLNSVEQNTLTRKKVASNLNRLLIK
mmetsp:Transcript_14919/g.28977  ORF Transcript_14919/g.28977 Transcript_14919/m.28977 type:complete len:474 (+) Transcript_14919:650-2071(+)